ncbi:MAG: signal peptide peptidase SppA [Saprospiraceae bacterium]|nr:signal peptide peptidase SppA [Saprospiraceae bacterium]
MKNFIKIVFGSCLGVILAIVVIGLVGSAVLTTFIASGKAKPSVTANSVLKLSFDRDIPEKTNNTEAAMYNFSEEPFIGLYEIAECIRHAKDDRNIKGIYLSLSSGGIGNASAQYLRDAIRDFKESGKFVYAYSGNYGYSQGAYYMASVADKVMLHPLGAIDLRGFGSEIPFFKEMLDRLGIKMNVFYAGKYKGATEPFRLNQLSDENRYQIHEYIEDLYDSFLGDIAQGRQMSADQVRNLAEELGGRNADLAKQNQLIDAIMYEDEVFDALREELDFSKDEKVNLVDLETYYKVKGKDLNLSSRSKIAVVYAEGEIRGGDDQYGMITDDQYVGILRKIRDDENTKAVVLRINSPGGDAFVSDEIWREVQLVREKGIPVVASMGDVAASGGYYIACGADRIIAEPNTITGSIGVFGLIPNISELMNEKLGIHMDTVRTAKYANGVVNPFYPVGPDEAAIIQEGIDRTYETFLSRVAQGRNMTRDAVHEIAQGRVWTGTRAKEIGLVDELGDMDRAIALAAELSGTDEYRITEYPRLKEPMQKLIEDLTGQDLPEEISARILAKHYPHTNQLLNTLEYMLKSQHPFARLPFDLHLN